MGVFLVLLAGLAGAGSVPTSGVWDDGVPVVDRHASPTVVAEVHPGNGAIGVDPGAEQLRITFSRGMRQGGMSLIGGGEFFPEITGRPFWVSARTVAVPVRLQPGHEYRLSINDERHDNFRDARGRAIPPYAVRFMTADAEPGEPDHRWDAVIDRAAELLGTRYAYRDRLGIEWGAVIGSAREELSRSRTTGEFAHKLGVVLAGAQDRHIWLEADGLRWGTTLRVPAANTDRGVVEAFVGEYERLNPLVAVGWLPGGVAYLAIESWDASMGDQVRRAVEALGDFADASALVIDVRLNGGGDERLAREVAGCFVDEPVVYAQHALVDPDAPEGYGPVEKRTLGPNTEGPRFRGPVAVLTGPGCMSSCEAFVLMMRAAGARVVGASTLGSSGNPKPFDLGEGVTLHLPSWRAMTPEGEGFEGVGIEPDVEVGYNWHDPSVLERALEVLGVEP